MPRIRKTTNPGRPVPATRNKRNRTAARLILASLAALIPFGFWAIDRGLDMLIKSEDPFEQHIGLFPARVYQYFVAFARSPHVRETVIVEIDPSKEFETLHSEDVCTQREFLADLLERIATAAPRAVVVDKWFVRKCADPRSTQKLQSTLDRLRQRVPIIIGLKTSRSDEDDYLEPSQLTGGEHDDGILNLPKDTRHLVLRWRVYADEDKRKRLAKETLALASVLKADSNRVTTDDKLPRFIDADEEPFIGFLGTKQWSEAHQHFSAGEILYGRMARRSDSWRNCIAGPDPVQMELHNRIVVVGETSDSDLHSSVIGLVQGFYLQANYIEALMDSRFLTPLGPWWDWGIASLFLIAYVPFVHFLNHHSRIHSKAKDLSASSKRLRHTLMFVGLVTLPIVALWGMLILIVVFPGHWYIDPIPSLGMPILAVILEPRLEKILHHWEGAARRGPLVP